MSDSEDTNEYCMWHLRRLKLYSWDKLQIHSDHDQDSSYWKWMNAIVNYFLFKIVKQTNENKTTSVKEK